MSDGVLTNEQRKKLMTLALKYTKGNLQAAEDLVSEVQVKVYAKRDSLVGNQLAYCRKTLNRVAIDQFRRRQRRVVEMPIEEYEIDGKPVTI